MAAPCALAKSKLAQHVQGLKQYPLSDRIVAGIKTGYLATATSRVKHIASVALTQGYRGLVEQPVRVAADYITAIGKAAADNKLGQFQKYRTTTSTLTPRGVGLVGRAGARGLREAITAIRTGVDPEAANNAFDIGRVQLKNPLLRAIQNRITVVVSATNKPFFNMALQASLLDQAQTLSKISGESVDYHLSHISDEMAQRALDEASYSTFNDNGPMAQGFAAWKGALRRIRDNPSTLRPRERAFAQAAKEGLTGDAAAERANRLLSLQPGDFNKQVTVPRERAGSVLGRATKGGAGGLLAGTDLLIPFARIGLNLGEAGLELTPAGVPYALSRALFARDGRVFLDGVIKAGAGTASLVALGYYLRSKGVITGGGSAAKGEKNVQAAAGDQPYSAHIKGVSHRYDWVEPISFPLALGADLFDQISTTPDDRAAALMRAEGQNVQLLTQKGILGSFAQVADIGKLNARAAIRYVESVLSVPPIVGQIAKGTDTVRDRDTRGSNPIATLANEYKAKIPGLRETLPEKPDAFGNVAKRPEGLAGSLLDPSNPETLTPSPLIIEMQRLGVGISTPGKSITVAGRKIALGAQEYRELLDHAGPATESALKEVMADPDYAGATDEQRAKVMEDVIKDTRSEAKAPLIYKAVERMAAVQRQPAIDPVDHEAQSLGIKSPTDPTDRELFKTVIDSPHYQQLDQMAQSLVQNDPRYRGRDSKALARELKRGQIQGALSHQTGSAQAPSAFAAARDTLSSRSLPARPRNQPAAGARRTPTDPHFNQLTPEEQQYVLKEGRKQ